MRRQGGGEAWEHRVLLLELQFQICFFAAGLRCFDRWALLWTLRILQGKKLYALILSETSGSTAHPFGKAKEAKPWVTLKVPDLCCSQALFTGQRIRHMEMKSLRKKLR